MTATPASAEVGLRFAALLRGSADELLRQWTRRVLDDPRVPLARRLGELDLQDHIPKLLESLIRDFEAARGGEEAGRALGAGEAAKEHARHRIRQGYRVTEALRELSHFRAAILDLGAATGAPLDARVAALLHAAVDESMIAGALEMDVEREELLDGERSARTEAERAARLRDEFVATVSHELRSPLNAILGWTAMLRSGRLDAATAAKALEVVERNARAQAALVEDLLDLSRIGSGKLRIASRRVDIGAVVESAVASHAPAAEAKGLTLTRDIAPMCMVQGDGGRIEQIVSNLLSNAIKFTPRGGRVEVRCRLAGDRVEIAVRDTGTGFAADFLPHVFERFRQADASLTRRHGGLGIGLALAKHLVDQHGGEIRAESDGGGRGSTFTVSLPTAARPSQRPDALPEACEALKGLTALVVDDEEDARVLLRRILEECDAQVVASGSAAEGLDQLRRLRPGVLISDIGMPDLDGYHLIRAVRALDAEEGGAIPAVAVTAFARPEDEQRALRAGYQAHLAKPFSPSDLIMVVATVTGRIGGPAGAGAGPP